MDFNLIGSVLFKVIIFVLRSKHSYAADIVCPSNCACDWTKNSVDCSNLSLSFIPDLGTKTSLVEQLDFSKNNLSRISNDTFDKFTSLRILYLHYNVISEVENGAFSKLHKLYHLKISENLLTVIKKETFKDLLYLTKLELGENKIEKIEDNAITNISNLATLDFSHNFLSSLNTSSVSKLPSLTDLYLKDNRFPNVPTDFFSRTPALKFLLMNKNDISSVDKFAFRNCPLLDTLHLSDNSIHNIHKLGFSIMSGGSNIKNLSLSALYLSNNKLDVIPSAISSARSLKSLELSGNQFEKVSPFSLYTLSKLKNLYLTQCNNLKIIESKAFAGLTNLRNIYLANNQHLQYIAEDAFVDSKEVTAAFLENNDLRNVSQSLLDWDNLHLLNIGANSFICSCDIVWIQRSEMLRRTFISDKIKNVKCSSGNKTLHIVELDPKEMGCPFQKTQPRDNTRSRLITGLIAASVVSCTLILCFILISCRSRFYSKYIHFKYRRQRDDPLFTVEDPRGKSKMFSSKSVLRSQGSREETLM